MEKIKQGALLAMGGLIVALLALQMGAATDKYGTPSSIWTIPSAQYDPVTPSDSTDLTTVCRSLYIGSVAGGTTLRVIEPPAPNGTGATVDFSGLTAGSILPIRAARVKSSGTTVTSIVALNCCWFFGWWRHRRHHHHHHC